MWGFKRYFIYLGGYIVNIQNLCICIFISLAITLFVSFFNPTVKRHEMRIAELEADVINLLNKIRSGS